MECMYGDCCYNTIDNSILGMLLCNIKHKVYIYLMHPYTDSSAQLVPIQRCNIVSMQTTIKILSYNSVVY